ncbi:hypothetical protein DMUE_2120 [Dictyocoela muelleri]|nr:hypothetical protein DMUE_2120 [Dictyocoela muelleri]
MKIAQWDNVTAAEVLRTSIDSKYFHLVDNTSDINEMISRIFSEKYPSKHYLKYLNTLSNIKQNYFLTIKEYKTAIEETCKRLAICMGWSKEQEIINTEESFYHGLSSRIQLEMSRLNVSSIAMIFK